jgi:glycosyltransferase involved in cell wall biosynthesis
MADISLLTPLYRPEISYLEDSYGDIVAQDVNWEWIIHWDGPETAEIPQEIRDDPRVHLFSGESRWGIAITRNRALMKASGKIIHAHDYDDRLMPDALGKAVEVLGRDPAIAYTCGHWDDLVLQNGSWTRGVFPSSGLQEGPLRRGWKSIGRMEDGKAIAPPPGSYTFRRLFLEAYGGWGALSTNEDTMIVSVIRAHHEGFYLPGLLGLYRKHAGNITKSREMSLFDSENKAFVEKRLRALDVIKHLDR